MADVYCLFLTESDGFAYFCEILVGVFDSQASAEEALLLHVDKMKSLLEINESRRKERNELLDRILVGPGKKATATYEQLEAFDKAWEAENGPWTEPVEDINRYEIRCVPVGVVFQLDTKEGIAVS